MISEENHSRIVWQRTSLELGNNNAIITVINTFICASCWMLLRDIVAKS